MFPSTLRPGRANVLPLALSLTYGVGLWLVVLHQAEGGHEHAEPSLLLHWLRDSTLALPAVLVAVCAAAALASRVRSGSDGLDRAVLAAAAAAGTATVFAGGGQVHGWLFDAHEAHELPPLVHAFRDGLVALAAALPLAGVLVAARNAVPRRTLRFAVAIAGALALASVAGATVRAAALGPGEPCPAGAPLKQFDVQAIDLDIPLNRFGDHDPLGKMYVLADRVADVRAQEASKKVSTGLHGDAIQPLVIRANEGDCVEISFTNNASGGEYGMHIDGLSFTVASSGDAVGANASSAVARGATATYRYFVPDSPALEGAHYVRPGPGNRAAVSHGLFGVLSVEPPGSTYLDLTTGAPLLSGWEASIVPGTGRPSFREFVQIYHEVGNEDFRILDANGLELNRVDPLTGSYRPGARAMNYRSEPFMNRLEANENEEAQGYGSYAFGDPATPSMRGYLRDPTKIRLVHGGAEMFHVFHLHGGGDRWRFNPLADTTYDYAATGLDKHPKTQASPSTRLDSQSFGPGENYNLEIEGGAGAVQQAAGDFLYHCHIASHYVSGMWAFWRVFDTVQPGLVPLPDRAAPPTGVDSAGLIGRTMPDGTVLTAANLDDWIRPQLPPQGIRKGVEDASVWNWAIDRSNPDAPVYLGEPEDTRPWPDLPNVVPGHPGSLPGDELVGTRPKIKFNPLNGRPAWPLLRPHIGFRPPFSANGHSGAPYLGENGDADKTSTVDPFAGRADGLCPTGSQLRRFNVVAITLPIRNTPTAIDPDGMIFVLAKNRDAVLAGTKPAEPLAIRTNIGECDAVTLTSELRDDQAFTGFSKVNMHIHHVQFDPQASDGVITGLSYEQSVRPYRVEDPTLTAAVAPGDTTLRLSSVAKFQRGVWIGVGLGLEKIEIRQIATIDAASSSVTVTRPLETAHAAGEWAGVEFTQYRWYPDVLLDNVFWHDHVDGIHGWGHGLVGQLIVEPAGSTYHDPRTGAEVDSGTIVDVHTTNSLAPGLVDGSFREFALWEIDENPNSDSTLNLKAEPWADRLSPLTGDPDPSLLFSSYRHGDPITPLPRAYPGDPFVIRTIQVGPSVDGLHVDGHRFFLENRYVANGKLQAEPYDTLPYGISERFTLALQGGAGGTLREPGDYLYMNSIGRRFRQGAWGILRVLPGRVDDLQPLPGTAVGAGSALPSPNGGRPPAAAGPGEPCPATAPVRSFDVSAIEQSSGNSAGKEAAFVLGSAREATEPLVLHAAAGDCVSIRLTNRRSVRTSFHLGKLLRRTASSGVNVGFTPEQTVAPGQTRTYRFFADDDSLESALISDFGGADEPEGVEVDSGPDGLYGALVVAPARSTFTDPVTGAGKDFGSRVDVHPPGEPAYRDFTLIFSDRDPQIGQNVMPYPTRVVRPALLNYQTAERNDDSNAFSSAANGDPRTPILTAYSGDPMRVHALAAPGSEQVHVFNLGGFSWPIEPRVVDAEEIESRVLPPWTSIDAHVIGGAGGRNGSLGDFFVGDLRRPFTLGGIWGLQRVVSPAGCRLRGLDGVTCP
jgi:FtsP/CotA-like multicopper oxidase with cupredoxin domain